MNCSACNFVNICVYMCMRVCFLMLVFTMLQVQIGTHSFTFDHVYGSTGSPSSAMFDECIAPLVDGLFQGYNATVLAYGQVKIIFCEKSCSIEAMYACIISFLSVNISICYRQDLEKHIQWELASKMDTKQE